MRSRYYTRVVTIGDISVYDIDQNPNGVLSAALGSIAVRSDAPITYQNTDGGTSWKILGNAATLPTPQIAIPSGIQNDSSSPDPTGGGPFTFEVNVYGVTQDMVDMGIRLWMYRYSKNRNSVRAGNTQKISKFVHPSTNNGPQFSNFSGGEQYGVGGSVLIRSIQTEWPLAVGNQSIAVTIDPNDWYQGPIVFPVTQADWNNLKEYRLRAQSGSRNPGSRKTAVFCFRVAVEDPNRPGRPLLGPFSGNFLLSPRFNGSDYIQWQVITRQT